jgi:hypothetical protein
MIEQTAQYFILILAYGFHNPVEMLIVDSVSKITPRAVVMRKAGMGAKSRWSLGADTNLHSRLRVTGLICLARWVNGKK